MPKATKTVPETPVLPQKRKYTKRPPTAPLVHPAAAPEPPNLAILALQQDIVDMVQRREQAQQGISQAMVAVSEANSSLQIAQQHFTNLEREVQYRMGLITQMRGGVAPISHFSEVANYISGREVETLLDIPNGQGVSIPEGVGSIPAPSMVAPQSPGGRKIRSEAADGIRNAELGVRAAI